MRMRARNESLIMGVHPAWLMALLAALCFTLAARLQTWYQGWSGNRAQTGLLQVLLGDGKKLFAHYFFTQADVYFHSGYYPSMFDQKPNLECHHLEGSEEDHAEHDHADPHEAPGHPEAPAEEPAHGPVESAAEGKQDWIARFGRHFYPSSHVHLSRPMEEREILPWLRLSAELDAHRVETYTVAAFWLRSKLGKVDEAEQFLREGLRANPDSPEILFELGRLLDSNRKDTPRARNLWELALRKWNLTEAPKKEPNRLLLAEITVHLARLEEREGNLPAAIHYLGILKMVSPHPDKIQRQIDELQSKSSTAR